MSESLGVRELRQNLSKHLARVKGGESITVTEHGRVVARLVPAASGTYQQLAERFGATVPTETLEEIIAGLDLDPSPAGTADALIAEMRAEHFD